MSLTTEDKNWIKDTISVEITGTVPGIITKLVPGIVTKIVTEVVTENTKQLILWISDNFPTKTEVVNIIDQRLIPIKEDINEIKDNISEIKYRLDEAEIPFIVKAVDQNKAEIERVKRFVNYKENNF